MMMRMIKGHLPERTSPYNHRLHGPVAKLDSAVVVASSFNRPQKHIVQQFYDFEMIAHHFRNSCAIIMQTAIRTAGVAVTTSHWRMTKW